MSPDGLFDTPQERSAIELGDAILDLLEQKSEAKAKFESILKEKYDTDPIEDAGIPANGRRGLNKIRNEIKEKERILYMYIVKMPKKPDALSKLVYNSRGITNNYNDQDNVAKCKHILNEYLDNPSNSLAFRAHNEISKSLKRLSNIYKGFTEISSTESEFISFIGGLANKITLGDPTVMSDLSSPKGVKKYERILRREYKAPHDLIKKFEKCCVEKSRFGRVRAFYTQPQIRNNLNTLANEITGLYNKGAQTLNDFIDWRDEIMHRIPTTAKYKNNRYPEGLIVGYSMSLQGTLDALVKKLIDINNQFINYFTNVDNYVNNRLQQLTGAHDTALRTNLNNFRDHIYKVIKIWQYQNAVADNERKELGNLNLEWGYARLVFAAGYKESLELTGEPSTKYTTFWKTNIDPQKDPNDEYNLFWKGLKDKKEPAFRRWVADMLSYGYKFSVKEFLIGRR